MRVFIALLVLLLATGCSRRAPDPLQRAEAFYSQQPRYLQPVPYTPVPEGLTSLSAADCGGCHVEYYEEWRISTHARAWADDAQFMEELHKPRESGDVSWMCVNCHTPLMNQLPMLVVGLVDGRLDMPETVANPHFDAALQLEAITCATCHVRDGVVLGPRGDSVAPHPVRRDPDLLSSAVCTQCHQATANFPEIGLACSFNTGQELADSAHGAAGATCQSCHMPAVERPLVPGGSPVRTSRRHWFGGSLIPKHPSFEAEIAPLRDIFPEGMRVDWVNLPEVLVPGEPVTIEFSGANVAAGHMLPSGDPERYITVRASAVTTDGVELASELIRIGQQWEWHPVPRQISDNRLAPGETRLWPLSFTAPQNGAVVLELEASKWRISPENFAYHNLEGRYVAGRTFSETSVQLEVGAPAPSEPSELVPE